MEKGVEESKSVISIIRKSELCAMAFAYFVGRKEAKGEKPDCTEFEEYIFKLVTDIYCFQSSDVTMLRKGEGSEENRKT